MFAFHPFSHMRDEFPLMGRGPGDLRDKGMEMSEPWSTGALVNDFSQWFRPQAPCFHHACVPDRPPRSSRQLFMILPSILSDTNRSFHDQQNSEKGAPCSEQCQGKGTAGSEQTAPPPTSKDAAESTNTDKAHEESPWQFSVDMKGCDDVRATTENGTLRVEGRGSSDTSRQMVRYITSLPRHVNHDALTATLSNGRLTVTQRDGAKLEGPARTLPIDVQKQKSPQPEQQQQQQQQQSAEVAEQKEKAISSTDAQEEQSCKAATA